MSPVSALHPVDPATVADAEKENHAIWIVRKLAQSMTGRIVMSSYESLRATGASVICLSPWGDPNPLVLPCIRFRDIAMHTAMAATGGAAAIAAPIMGPVADTVIGTVGDSIGVEIGLHLGFDLATRGGDELITHTIEHRIPLHSARLNTTAVKTLLITLKFKHTIDDAALGFFRSSVHHGGDPQNSLFSNISDYLAVEKGWFSPYLFASNRRPVIPRNMKPDVVFCHGPFLQGDYRVAQTLLDESASIVALCDAPPPVEAPPPPPPKSSGKTLAANIDGVRDKITGMLNRSRTPSPTPETTLPVGPPPLRRMVILLLGITPHRGNLWTTSSRPGESVINYHLLNGCPAVVLPLQPGSPLLAWDTLTLQQLQKINDQGGIEGEKFKGVVTVLFEYVSLCVDWERIVLPEDPEVKDPAGAVQTLDERRKGAVKDAVQLVVVGAVQSKGVKEVGKHVDAERAGIVMFRIP